MMNMDLLSDTVYRNKAMEVLQQSSLPVSITQIKGLRQIAQHQPSKIQDFAQNQKTRADKKGRDDESTFWQLVIDLCSDSTERVDWSLRIAAESDLPMHLHLKNIPSKQDCKTQADRTRRNQLMRERNAWLKKWDTNHIPAFFQRFCTHYLYLKARS